MENKKYSFWFVLLISLLVYTAMKLLRTGVKILFGAITIFTDFSLLPPASVFMGILTAIAVIVMVKLSGNVYVFPLAVLTVELVYDVRTAIKSSDTLSTISETADFLGWFDETVLTIIDSVGAGGRMLYIGYCFVNSLVLFGALLLLSAVVRCVVNRKNKTNKDTI